MILQYQLKNCLFKTVNFNVDFVDIREHSNLKK